MRGDPTNRLAWTWELHRFKGNVLLADGRVEEWNNAALASAADSLAGGDVFLPTVPAAAGSAAGQAASAQNEPDTDSSTPAAATAPGRAAQPDHNTSGNQSRYRRIPTPAVPTPEPPQPARTNASSPPSTNASVPKVIVSTETKPLPPQVDRRLVNVLRGILFGFYLLILLILLFWFLLTRWRRSVRRRTLDHDGL